MSIAAIDNAINAQLSGFATVSYVDGRDALNATQAYIDAQDNLRLKLAQKNIANGIPSLDANGRVAPARINAILTQKYIAGPWSPNSYHTVPVDITTEQTLYSLSISDPGFPYKLMVFGQVDGRNDLESEYAVINVRAATATGEIIAQGISGSDSAENSVPGLGDEFQYVSTGLNPTDWASTDMDGGAGNYNVNGSALVWGDVGNNFHSIRYRRIKPEDKVTHTDYQKLRMQVGSVAGETPFGGGDQWFRLCGRMSDAENSWAGIRFTHNTCWFEYASAGEPAVMGGAGFSFLSGNPFSLSTPAGTTVDLLTGTSNNVREYLAFSNDVLVGGALDANGVTSVGPGFRGWGFWGHADTRSFGFGQTSPPSVERLLIDDAPPSSGAITIVPNNPASLITRTGTTTLYVRAVSSGDFSGSLITPYRPKLSVFAVRAA